MHDKQQWIGTLISFGILFLVLALRMRKMRTARPLRIERLWILPAFFGLVVALLYWAHPPQGLFWLYAALALIAGLGLGWYRGKLMHITVDPQTQEICQQSSMAAMIFIFVLVGLRYLARGYAEEMNAQNPEMLYATTDILLAFGLGFISAQRLEMGQRARRLLLKAQGQVFD
jgi:hypothetical protein